MTKKAVISSPFGVKVFTVQRYCPAFRADHAILVHNLLITDTVAVLLGHKPMKTCPHG